MAETTRRRFLRAGAVAGAGLLIVRNRVSAQGLGAQFAMPSQPPCTDTRKATPRADAEAYRANSPQRSRLYDQVKTAKHLELSGSVIGLTCGNIKDARVEIWHADPNGQYDMAGFAYRGYRMTDAQGRFNFTTVMPGAVGTRAPRINARVTPPGKDPLTTSLFFPNDLRNAADPAFKPELLMAVTQMGSDDEATFNFILNL